MLVRLYILGILLLSASSARAGHDHHGHDHHGEHGDASALGAGVTLVAASYDTMLFVGNYQGVQPAVTWSNHRVAVGTSAALYRIERNGASYYGFGDLVVHGQAALVASKRVRAGVVAGVSVPIGDEQHGLGMGHVMVMPAAFGALAIDALSLSATAGYGRALGADGGGHDHGMWPIVEPMNMSELTWSAGGDYGFGRTWRAGARVSGGVPIGGGDNRVVGTVRLGWRDGRFATAGELQAGIAGDPFTVRGLVSTTMTF